ncbi:MAG: PQQ-dependent sugar dehydrogenase [ANME-2 cluster archaeon]|nr:PQQ-dependent sugar dehydrogenase [ANME-2 cluster archaeon]
MKINSRILVVISIVVVIIAVSSILFQRFGVRPSIDPGSMDDIQLPPGFTIDVYAQDLGGSSLSFPEPNTAPRMLLLKDGILYVSLTRQGKVVALPDSDRDNKADETIIFIDGLNNPHGLDFSDGWFYIAEETRVIRIKDRNNDLVADRDSLEVLIDDLPGGGHFTRSIRIHNNSLYLSIGSSCNVCNEQDGRRAAISRCDLDGTDCEIFARGLRNAVGITFHPLTGEMYVTENGRDLLGDDIPPDELNLVREGTNYGWPICYGQNIHDTQFDKNVYIRNPCEQPFEMPALVDLQAHSAPLGLMFYYGENFPEQYRGDLFVAFHGSWNRKEPTGYKIVTIDMNNFEVNDFATGWLKGGTVSGRPVDIITNDDGSLFVSDDYAGKIYRIYYLDSDL